MIDTIAAHARRAVRPAQGHVLRAGTAPVRVPARTALRLRPRLEPRPAERTWLWQPGWGRSAQERPHRTPDPYRIDGNTYENSKFDLVMDTLGDAMSERVLESAALRAGSASDWSL